MIREFLVTAGFVFALMPAAFADDAQTPPPDKSAYTLFNPVPDDLMRGFSTDRPAKSSTATTVDAGHFQYESDVIDWTYDRYNSAGVTTSSLMVFAPVLKVGLMQRTDLEIALLPINIDHTTNKVTAAHNADFGFGDITGRVKVNLFGNEGGNYALAIVPYVKAPTADSHIGNGHWEGGGYVPFNIALPHDWSMTLQTELDILENANLDGMHANYQNLINFQHPVFGNLSAQMELWSDVSADHNAPTQYTFDLAGLWAITGNIQLDFGANIGLNKAAPDLQTYIGLSQRF